MPSFKVSYSGEGNVGVYDKSGGSSESRFSVSLGSVDDLYKSQAIVVTGITFSSIGQYAGSGTGSRIFNAGSSTKPWNTAFIKDGNQRTLSFSFGTDTAKSDNFKACLSQGYFYVGLPSEAGSKTYGYSTNYALLKFYGTLTVEYKYNYDIINFTNTSLNSLQSKITNVINKVTKWELIFSEGGLSYAPITITPSGYSTTSGSGEYRDTVGEYAYTPSATALSSTISDFLKGNATRTAQLNYTLKTYTNAKSYTTSGITTFSAQYEIPKITALSASIDTDDNGKVKSECTYTIKKGTTSTLWYKDSNDVSWKQVKVDGSGVVGIPTFNFNTGDNVMSASFIIDASVVNTEELQLKVIDSNNYYTIASTNITQPQFLMHFNKNAVAVGGPATWSPSEGRFECHWPAYFYGSVYGCYPRIVFDEWQTISDNIKYRISKNKISFYGNKPLYQTVIEVNFPNIYSSNNKDVNVCNAKEINDIEDLFEISCSYQSSSGGWRSNSSYSSGGASDTNAWMLWPYTNTGGINIVCGNGYKESNSNNGLTKIIFNLKYTLKDSREGTEDIIRYT